jgi:hypothetical protein
MECFVIASCLALVQRARTETGTDYSPTDPVLAASVVKGVFAEVSLLFLPSEIKLM